MIRRAAALLLSFCAAAAFASESALTGGRLLEESLSARPSGLAEAGTAMTGDLNALSFNPAGLALMRRSEASARFQTSPGGVSSGVLSYGKHLSRAGLGLSAAYLDAGTIDLSFTSGAQYSRNAQRDYAGQAAFGFAVSNRLAFGLGGRYLSSTLVEDYKATAFAGDAGLLYAMPVDGWLVGASVRNMGSKLTYKSVGDPLPGEVRVGTSYAYAPEGHTPQDVPTEEWYGREEEEAPIFTTFLDGIRDQKGKMSGAAGFEWTKWPKAAFRFGYGWGENATGPTLGFGLNLVKFSLDYSWRLIDDLSDQHRVSLSIYWE